MFEGFPYTNFHELNLDWIIKIAKDFLDQYTNIQQTITQGLEDLDTKAEQLQALLDAWYEEHSEDIATQLEGALQDLNDWYTAHEGYLDQYVTDSIAAFGAAADAKAAETIASIPADYSTLSNDVNTLFDEITEVTRNLFDKYNPNSIDATFASSGGGYVIAENPNNKMIIFPVDAGETYTVSKMSSGRFRYGTFATLPAVGATMIQVQTGNDSATEKTITIDESAHYLAVLYYNSTVDTTSDRTPEKILDTLQIEKGSSATPYIAHLSAIDLFARKTASENTTAISETNVIMDEIKSRTKNLFDWNHANRYDGNIARSGDDYIITTGSYKMFWMEVEEGWYTISKVLSYRFRYGVSTTNPEIAGTVLTQYSIANDDVTAKSVDIHEGEKYLVVMYYSPDHDTLTEEEILKSIMVEKGANKTAYMPYWTANDAIARQSIANAVGGNIFAMFDNVTCIGDSLTYSEVFTGSVAHRQAKRTYPEVLAALSGNTTENLGVMGDSTEEWWDHKSAEIRTKENQLFIVYLGTNGGLTDTIDTDCPGDDIGYYANTNTGCYGKILQTIKNMGDVAVLVHIYGGGGDSGVDGTNEVIDKFGERYGFAVLDNEKLLDQCYHVYPDRSGMNNLHYNDLGYAVFAGRLIGTINALPPEEAIKLVPHS